MKITIIGAGIAGLTTAIALKQKGFEVEIYETSKNFKKAGSGINLAINAMQVYQKLGLYQNIVNKASYTQKMTVRNQNFKLLSTVDLKDAENIFDAKTFAIHRATLHNILVNELQDVQIHLDKKLKSLTQTEKKVNLTFKDGTSKQSDLVIGADGIHSAVRKSIFDNTELRNAQQACWRGIVKTSVAKEFQTELNEMWGNGKRFGFVAINKEEIYWFALTNCNENCLQEFNNIDLVQHFSNFHPIIKKILLETKKEAILFNEMKDLKPIDNWYADKVCLVGDSAHATTPNMGQGANQAIESAYVLAECLKTEKDIYSAFKKYQEIRKNVATNVVKQSWNAGKLAQLENRLAIILRNSIMKLLPNKLIQKQAYTIFELKY